jgi:hypothetical protein
MMNIKEKLSDIFRNFTKDFKMSLNSVRDNIETLKQKMDEDPQVRTAVIHCATYAACLLIPLGVGAYLSMKHDGTPNVWRVPDGSKKIEMVQPD